MSEIETQVKQIVVDHLGIDDSKVTPEAKSRTRPKSEFV